MSNTLYEAKNHLDIVIKKVRIHFYKPIQIAEILRIHRENLSFDLNDLESYRNSSKKCRDQISQRIVGNICTSSARFQDNLFEINAMPPRLIAALGEENEKSDRAGIVEAYIYNCIGLRIDILKRIESYIANASPDRFDFAEFLNNFRSTPGLKRSIDKAYEITVYALFSTLARYLNATITVRVPKDNMALLREFEDFTRTVLGITADRSEIVIPARLYRAGVANAADRGIDMWTNFGPAVQIKHLSLTEDAAEDIVSQISADRIVVVCLTAEKTAIERILSQLGFSDRIQGIATQDDLERWYSKCFSEKHRDTLGISLLKDLHREFISEFPSVGDEFSNFMMERGYTRIQMVGIFSNLDSISRGGY